MKKLLIISITFFNVIINPQAHAFDISLLTILVKIYDLANKQKEIQETTQLPAKTPEHFARSKDIPPPEPSNLTVDESNLKIEPSISPDEKDSNLTPSDVFERMQEQHRRAVQVANSNRTRILGEMASGIQSQHKDTENELYLQEFKSRNLSPKEFNKLYYSNSNGSYLRNNVTLNNATDKEKINLEKSLQFKEEQLSYSKKYHQAFQLHIKNVVKYLSYSFVNLRQIMIKGDSLVQPNFNLNPAGDAMQIKNMWAGVTNYEISHPELKTNCLYGIGGKNEFLPDCDKILSIITSNYNKTHTIKPIKLTHEDLRKIAYAINPRESLD